MKAVSDIPIGKLFQFNKFNTDSELKYGFRIDERLDSNTIVIGQISQTIFANPNHKYFNMLFDINCFNSMTTPEYEKTILRNINVGSIICSNRSIKFNPYLLVSNTTFRNSILLIEFNLVKIHDHILVKDITPEIDVYDFKFQTEVAEYTKCINCGSNTLVLDNNFKSNMETTYKCENCGMYIGLSW